MPGKGEFKVDYVLHKVLSLLRAAVPQLDDDPAEVEAKERPHILAHDSDTLSAHSTGGGVSSPDEFDSKRVHKDRSFQAQKRLRRQSLPTPDEVELLDRADVHSALECAVCFQLVTGPVTSPCGHTFCGVCLLRAHDHVAACPLCRSDLPLGGGLANATLQGVLDLVFQGEMQERKAQLEEEAKGEGYPIFVCTLSWVSLRL